MAIRYKRTVEESQTVISHAKIDESDLKPITQPLYFSDKADLFENFKFIEIEPNLLEILQEGEVLKFCGSKDDNAVLCTKSKTYEVKEAETSNSLLLLPSLKWSEEAEGDHPRKLEEREVYGVFYKYFELRQCLPNLHKLREILRKCMYKGPEHEGNVENNEETALTFEELTSCIQASEEELLEALSEESACCINGKWRMLEPTYHLRILSLILGVVQENSWTHDAVEKREVLDALKDIVPLEILTQCFRWYTEPVENPNGLYKLKERKICRFMGQMIIMETQGLSLENFMEIWKGSAEGMNVDLSYMDGLILIKKVKDRKLLYYFPEVDLPANISERFASLFETREKWTYEEIYPYIERFATGNMNVGALLTKFARTSKQDGRKYYTSKHGK